MQKERRECSNAQKLTSQFLDCCRVSYWQARYGGYSGDLKPTSALDLLKKDGNVVLVDIRPQVERENQGVPDLRRGARSRSAIVEIFKVGLTLDIV
jgi:hypothetical protein